MPACRQASPKTESTAALGFEAKLWLAADKLRNNTDAAEYKHVVLGLITTISFTAASEGEKTHRSVDLLGRVYEYFLTRFASAEGKNGGQFYTPSCVVRCLVEMLLPAPDPSRQAGAPYKGRIYDPACGSGGSSRNKATPPRADSPS